MGCRGREKERRRLRDTERQIKYAVSRQKGVKRQREGEEEAKGHRETDKYTESRQNGVKRQREGEEEAKGHRETDKIYSKQTEWGKETERRRVRG
jgi:hypothetical protein